jgi:hypothetical protein
LSDVRSFRWHGRAAMTAQMNEAEQRFAAYLRCHGYTWSHEPDYQAEFGLEEPLVTKPDVRWRTVAVATIARQAGAGPRVANDDPLGAAGSAPRSGHTTHLARRAWKATPRDRRAIETVPQLSALGGLRRPSAQNLARAPPWHGGSWARCDPICRLLGGSRHNPRPSAAMAASGGPGNRTPGCGFGDHPLCSVKMPLCGTFRQGMAPRAIVARL